MVAAEANRIEGQGGGDPLRRVVLGVLALYLARKHLDATV